MKKALLLLLFAFFLATASAQNVSISELKNVSAIHDTTASGSFLLLNNNSELNATNVSCSVSVSNFNATCSVPSEIANKSNVSATFTVTVPKYRLGTYNSIVNVNYTLNNTANTISSSFLLEVNRTASLQIIWIKEPSNLYAGQSMLAEFNVTNNGNIFLDGNATISSFLSAFYNFSLSPAESKNIVLNITTTNETKIAKHSILVNATGVNGSDVAFASSSKEFFVKYPYCNVVDSSKIALGIDNEEEIKKKGYKPLDVLRIETTITNKNSVTVYATLKAVLFSSFLLNETEASERVRIEPGKSEKAKVEIKLPAEIKEGYYYVYVKAHDGSCDQKDVQLFVGRESYDIMLIEVSIEPTTVKCGSSFTFKARVTNIGAYDEKKVNIEYKDEIGFSQSKLISDLYKGEKSALFSFSFAVPINASAGSKKITLVLNHEYDDMNLEFRKKKEFNYYIALEDCYEEKKVFRIETQPLGYLGRTFSIIFYIKNEGNVKATYEIDAEAEWAYIESITPKTFSLEAGKEETIIIKITPRKGTREGDYVLYTDITQDGKKERKEITVNLQKMPKSFYMELSEKIKENFIWVFINLVLIAIIIYVVSSIIRKRAY